MQQQSIHGLLLERPAAITYKVKDQYCSRNEEQKVYKLTADAAYQAQQPQSY
jgi:hypothetical protein